MQENYFKTYLYDLVEIVGLRLRAQKTSLCNPSKYRNISCMQPVEMFQPLSLNSKNRTIEIGLNVSNTRSRLEIRVDLAMVASVSMVTNSNKSPFILKQLKYYTFIRYNFLNALLIATINWKTSQTSQSNKTFEVPPWLLQLLTPNAVSLRKYIIFTVRTFV